MSDKNVLIQVKDLKKAFGTNQVLDGITTDICQGEVVAVIGPSGSGKSTFLRSLNLLEVPTGGQILFEGTDITDPKVDINRHRQKIGMVFQQFNLFPHKTLKQNIMLAPVYTRCQELKKAKRHNRLAAFGKKEQIPVTTTKEQIKKEAREQAMNLLKRIGLEDKANVYPSTLSGGQKQRVAIVRAMLMHPEIMLLDEITAALDPEMVREVLQVVLELAKTGMTMLIVAHEMEFARSVADRVIFMDKGNIVEEITPKQFFDNPETDRSKQFLNSYHLEKVKK